MEGEGVMGGGMESSLFIAQASECPHCRDVRRGTCRRVKNQDCNEREHIKKLKPSHEPAMLFLLLLLDDTLLPLVSPLLLLLLCGSRFSKFDSCETTFFECCFVSFEHLPHSASHFVLPLRCRVSVSTG